MALGLCFGSSWFDLRAHTIIAMRGSRRRANNFAAGRSHGGAGDVRNRSDDCSRAGDGGSCTIGSLSVADVRTRRCVFLPESLTSPFGQLFCRPEDFSQSGPYDVGQDRCRSGGPYGQLDCSVCVQARFMEVCCPLPFRRPRADISSAEHRP